MLPLLFLLQDNVLFTTMHLVLRLQLVVAAQTLQKDVRTQNHPHTIVRASINVRFLFFSLFWIEKNVILFFSET